MAQANGDGSWNDPTRGRASPIVQMKFRLRRERPTNYFIGDRYLERIVAPDA
jgi:hypothetical protein